MHQRDARVGRAEMPAPYVTAAAAAPATSTSGQLPSFLIVGPPRTGTTWLHHMLQPHTNLPAPTKETRFFDCHFHRGAYWYARHFPVIHPGRPTGEIAPTYFASRTAREGIIRVIPHAKLVFIFRNPVHLIVSLYRVKRAYGIVRWSFEEALDRDPELLNCARFATHLQCWLDAFPPEQILVTLYDDLRSAPQLYFDRLLQFLGLPCSLLNQADLGRVHSSERMTEPRNFLVTRSGTAVADWCKARNLDKFVATVRDSKLMKLFLGGGAPFPEASLSALLAINESLRPEVERLQHMIGRDLSTWDLKRRQLVTASAFD